MLKRIPLQASLDDLNARLDDSIEVPMHRFRPNIVLNGIAPWEEDTWSKLQKEGAEGMYVLGVCFKCLFSEHNAKMNGKNTAGDYGLWIKQVIGS